VLKKKRDLVIEGLQANLSDICTWSNPVGGLFLWLRMPEDTDMDKLVKLANDKGFSFMPGLAFHVDFANKPYIRLAFGHVPDDLIKEGIPVLAEAIKQSRTSNEPRNFDTLF
jgi:2-aminoadipate transaminase